MGIIETGRPAMGTVAGIVTGAIAGRGIEGVANVAPALRIEVVEGVGTSIGWLWTICLIVSGTSTGGGCSSTGALADPSVFSFKDCSRSTSDRDTSPSAAFTWPLCGVATSALVAVCMLTDYCTSSRGRSPWVVMLAIDWSGRRGESAPWLVLPVAAVCTCRRGDSTFCEVILPRDCSCGRGDSTP